MKVVVQRVLSSSCTVDGQITGQTGPGLCLFVGFCMEDTLETVEKMAAKVIKLRIFDDGKGAMNRSLLQVGGQILSISQFTLYASCKSGNRPSFTQAAGRPVAEPLYEAFNAALAKEAVVQTGIFGADMKIELVNDGPVTILLDSRELFG